MKKIILFLSLTFFSITLFGQKSESIYSQAIKYHKEKNYKKAIESYTKVIKKDSTNWLAFLNRGLCYLSLSEYDNMFLDCKKALYLNPTDTSVLLYSAEAYCHFGKNLEAITCYKKAVDRGVHLDYMNYGNLGSCYYFLGQNDSARKYLQISYDLNPTYILAVDNLAWANIEYDPTKACYLFKEAYTLDSLNVRSINNLGYSYLICGNLDKAFEFIHKAEKIDPANSFVYRNYGLYYLKENNKTLACQNLQKALDLKIIEEWGESYVSELMTYCNK